MLYILLGILSFIFLFFFDYYTLINRYVEKIIFGALGLGMLIYSSIMITFVSEKQSFPMTIKVLSGIMFLIFVFLLIYSLFLELPFVKTYGQSTHSNNLISTGTYALCRHPGVIWFGLMFFFYFFTTGAILIIPSGIIFTLIDVLHVYLQEKLFFPSMFPGYKEYMKTTPMLIPTKKSIKSCIATLRFRRVTR